MSKSTLWVSQLLQRHANVLTQQTAPDPDALKALNSLQLADAVVDKSILSSEHPSHALQVAVIGPTQSGKSTLVNFLLDTPAAAISALAGFTVHAQGYASGYSDKELALLTSMMSPMVRVPATKLQAEALDHYALETVEAGPAALLQPAVVWDTPDFDSIASGTYQRAVMNTIAMADIVVLTVSKDKYGDKSVWDLLELIQPLNQPLLVCINKLDPQDEQAVLQAFTQRFNQHLNAPTPPIVLLPFDRKRTPHQDQATTLPSERLALLSRQLQEAQQQVNRAHTAESAHTFVSLHKDIWFAPLLEEQEALAHWRDAVNQAVVHAEEQYAYDYLNNPDKYDTFNRTLAELLTLLEIPGLAPVLTRTRELVTWPARRLFGFGKNALDKRFEREPSSAPADQEAVVMQRLLDSALVSLQGELLNQRQQHAYWAALEQSFHQHEPQIRAAFLSESEAVRQDFELEIEDAAQRLYQQLKTQPSLLNTLRAARATADAAGVALAVKSGGLAAADLILAPAMLSVTTLLTESALGKYLDSIKAELKERQRHHVNTRLLQGVLAQSLNQLSNDLPNKELFSQHLEPELADALKQAKPQL